MAVFFPEHRSAGRATWWGQPASTPAGDSSPFRLIRYYHHEVAAGAGERLERRAQEPTGASGHRISCTSSSALSKVTKWQAQHVNAHQAAECRQGSIPEPHRGQGVSMSLENKPRTRSQWGEPWRAFDVQTHKMSSRQPRRSHWGAAGRSMIQTASWIGSMSVASSLSAFELLTRFDTAQRCR
jgi:hypothetical protein